MRDRTKKWIWTAARVIITGALIALLISMIDLGQFFSYFRRADKLLLAVMIAAISVPFFLLALRWWVILRAHGFDVPLRRAFFVSYAGTFFNNFLLGSVGGDIAKSVMVAAGEERRAAVVATIILDRVIGLMVMIVIGGACLVPFAGRLKDPSLAIIVGGLLAAMLLGYFAYFNRLLRDLLKNRLPFRGAILQIDEVFKSMRDRKRLVAVASAISALGQSTMILIIYGIACALGFSEVGLWAFFVFEPIIFIITALPISIGGLGVQEGAYAILFGTYAGLEQEGAIAISLIFKLGLMIASVPGGIFLMLGVTRRTGREP